MTGKNTLFKFVYLKIKFSLIHYNNHVRTLHLTKLLHTPVTFQEATAPVKLAFLQYKKKNLNIFKLQQLKNMVKDASTIKL